MSLTLDRGTRSALRFTALWFTALGCTALAPTPASAMGALLSAAEDARIVAVGVLARPIHVDSNAFVAELEILRVLSGDATPGSVLRITWEEPLTGRAPRFAAGEVLIVALESLPQTTRWQRRFPDHDAFWVARSGRAFARAPDPRSLSLLEAYLQLAEDSRDAEAGAAALAAIVAGADPSMAAAALQRLAAWPQPPPLTEAARAALTQVLGDAREERIEVRGRLVSMVGRGTFPALLAALEPLTVPGGAFEIAALRAIALQSGGLSEELGRALLAREDAQARTLATLHAGEWLTVEALAELATNDPHGTVRAAAVTAILRRGGADAVDLVLPALLDRDRSVVDTAAEQLAALGEPAVAPLEAFVLARRGAATAGAIAALSGTGAAGNAALNRLAQQHPDPEVQTLAALALGRTPPEH